MEDKEKLTNSTTITSNIVEEQDFKKQVGDTLNFLSNTLSNTLGPYGSTTMVQDIRLNHSISKDGYSILKSIMIKEDIPRTILDMIRSISQSQVRNVGDGSTSAVIVSSALYESLFTQETTFNYAPKDVINVLDITKDVLERMIKDLGHELNLDDKEELKRVLSKVAAISNNNDLQMGEFIADVYSAIGPEGHINIKAGTKPEHTFTIDEGLEVNGAFISSSFVNEPELGVSIFEEPLVLLMDTNVTFNEYENIILPAISHASQIQRPLTIVAEGYMPKVKEALVELFKVNHGKILFNAMDISVASKESRETFLDLGVFLGINRPISYKDPKLAIDMFNSDRIDNFLGSCKEITVGPVTSKFIGGNYDEERMEKRKKTILDEIKKLEGASGHLDIDSDLAKLKTRYHRLSQSIATIEVGGQNRTEVESRLFLVEDAVLACKSTIKNGYILGGNLAIPHILTHSMDYVIDHVQDGLMEKYGPTKVNSDRDFIEDVLVRIREAFKHSYLAVLTNKYGQEESWEILDRCVNEYEILDLINERYMKPSDSSIINSVYTDINIMKSAFSIIGLVGVSNQFMKTSLN